MVTTPQSSAGTPTQSSAGTPTAHRSRRGRRTLLGLLLAAATGITTLGAGAPAYADVAVAGVTFHSDVNCGGSMLVFTTRTSRTSGSYAMLHVWDPSSARWVTDNVWQDATAWSSFHVAGIDFRPGYYGVYVSYAQYTTAGWKYSGETITRFRQNNSFLSSRCYMGN